MAGASIEIKGMAELLAQVKALGPDLNQTLRPGIEKVLEVVKARMQEYPPERAGQTYRRTGNLRASWQTFPNEGSGDVLGVVRSSGVIYNRYVQDADAQAWMHQDRWQTAQEVAVEKQAEATAILSEFLQGLLSQ